MQLTKYKFKLSSSLERLLTKEQTESINEDIKFANRFLNVLIARLEKEIEDKIKEDESICDYESNNWALLKAERIGYRRAIRKVIEIIGPTKE